MEFDLTEMLLLTDVELGALADICADWLNSDFEPKRPEQVTLAHRIIDTLLVKSGFTTEGVPA